MNAKKLPDHIAGAIFDLDGTLLDSMGVWGQIDIDFLGRRGISVPPDYQTTIAPMKAMDIAVYTIRRFGLSDTPEGLCREWMEMAHEEYAYHLPLKPFALEYVDLLAKRGVKMAVATSSDRTLVEPALKRTGLADRISVLVTVSDVARGKGFPDVYLRAAEIIGIEPARCAVFEDVLTCVEGAKAGGFFAVGVYEAAVKHPPGSMESASDLYIRSFEELLGE